MRFISTYILLLFLISCKSPSDQIKDAFNTVNTALQKANNKLDRSVDQLCSTINLKRQTNQELASNADTICMAIKNADNLIDSLQDVMQIKDSSGTNTILPTNMLVKTRIGDRLTTALSQVYVSAYSYLIDNSKKQTLDSTLISLKEIRSNNDWTIKYFDSAPTVAAIAILSKFKNDCESAGKLIFADINERLE